MRRVVVQVNGRVDEDVCLRFPGVRTFPAPSVTLISGTVQDQQELLGLLNHLDMVGHAFVSMCVTATEASDQWPTGWEWSSSDALDA